MKSASAIVYQYSLYGMGNGISDVSMPDFKAYHFDIVERNVEIGKLYFMAGGKWG